METLNDVLRDITGLPEPLKFPERKIVVIPHDPLAHAVRDVQSAAHDFTFAIAEAANAKDLEGLAVIQRHLSDCLEALQVVEYMANDFEKRIQTKE